MDTERLWGINKKKKDKVWHSRAYHRYFEDYAERKEYKSDGSYTIRRIYVGQYYRQNISDKKWILNKLLYFGIAFIAAAITIIGESVPISVNHIGPVIVVQMLSIIVYLWMLFSIISYVTAKREMMVRTYRESSIDLMKCTKCQSILLLATAAVTIVAYIVTGDDSQEGNYLLAFCIASELTGSILNWILNRLESKMEYITIISNEKAQNGDDIIRY